jgi:hypothetical protein
MNIVKFRSKGAKVQFRLAALSVVRAHVLYWLVCLSNMTLKALGKNSFTKRTHVLFFHRVLHCISFSFLPFRECALSCQIERQRVKYRFPCAVYILH